ncbi:hypothetical protein MtrunA17_Chr4g0060371 [Medicago truncatula]|uniref:Transmembrane protein n=1 Tax=Medicago truncatula TaxID=3880 RepID=A0A396IDI3_MEDTR|nr:hypothetical protein MtrunA17_Chr4g0060371 [Medicago truncatula]
MHFILFQSHFIIFLPSFFIFIFSNHFSNKFDLFFQILYIEATYYIEQLQSRKMNNKKKEEEFHFTSQNQDINAKEVVKKLCSRYLKLLHNEFR